MDEETIKFVLATHQEMDLLGSVKKEIEDESSHRLSFLEFRKGSSLMERDSWYIVDMDKMKYIGDIPDRHDKQIRKEIDERINQLKRDLEKL